jgi:hypothetical protein
MSERQYRTLRKLFVLWLRIFIFKKHAVIKNIILIISFCLNGYFIASFIIPKNAIVPNDGFPTIREYYSLDGVRSITGSTSALQIYKKLKKCYDEDLKLPNYARYTKTREIDPEWRRNCIRSLRKVIILKMRVDDLEKAIIILNPEYQERSEALFSDKKYSENLSDMSNYYAGFLTQEDYDAIIRSFE